MPVSLFSCIYIFITVFLYVILSGLSSVPPLRRLTGFSSYGGWILGDQKQKLPSLLPMAEPGIGRAALPITSYWPKQVTGACTVAQLPKPLPARPSSRVSTSSNPVCSLLPIQFPANSLGKATVQ